MARRSDDQTPGLFDPRPPEPAKAPSPSPTTPAEASPPEPATTPRAPLPRLTVGQLTAQIKERLLELGRLRIEGEITGFKRHTSGHVYFDLKDEAARLACVIWRSTVARGLAFEPREGDQVLAVGRLDVYEPRGSYKLIVDRLEPLGIGALLAQLEKRKAELAARGWFERHRPLPAFPRLVGVVTSRDGAALRDFLRTRSLRWPGYPLRLCHAPVQGPGAAEALADAIGRLDRSGVDVIVLCRGGGSLEDLWAFNELAVAQAIWEASVPVVSGVGHESDTTLADLVADHRAHTPTDAAQTVLPDRGKLQAAFARVGNYLVDALERLLAARVERLASIASRPCLRGAEWILEARRQRLATAWARLQPTLTNLVHRRASALAACQTRLERRSPGAALDGWQRRLERARALLLSGGRTALERAARRLEADARALEGVSPLAVLGRGYSLTTRAGETLPLTDVAGLAPGDEVETRLAAGRFRARVEDTQPEEGETSGGERT